MELFFAERSGDNRLFLDEEETHHCLKVLRHKEGDFLMITDGLGKLFRARFTGVEKKKILLEETELIRTEPSESYSLHIGIAVTKNIDRFEWFLEKATEIGVSEITPLICQRSERDKIKPERLKKILVSAMKQSLRLWLPKLNPMVPFKHFSSDQNKSEAISFICHCQAQNLPSLQSLYKKNRSATILIGPEGDFTTDEIALAEEKGYHSVSLGVNRLRTETAGMVAVHTVRLLNC